MGEKNEAVNLFQGTYKEFVEKLSQLTPDERDALNKEIKESVEKTAMENFIRKLNLPPLKPGYKYEIDLMPRKPSDLIPFDYNPHAGAIPAFVVACLK